MSNSIDLDRVRRAAALQEWAKSCRDHMGRQHRYPEIDFDSETWPIRSTYKTNMQDINFASTLRAFAGLEGTYEEAIRCLTSEQALADKNKSILPHLDAWQLLARTGPYSLLDLRRSHLTKLETTLVEECASSLASATTAHPRLQRLVSIVDRLSRAGVVDSPSWSLSHETRTKLLRLSDEHRRKFRDSKATTLDRQIEALSDAMTALFRGDERLSSMDRAALATMGVLMCVPSRVNEPLCMSVDDVFTIEDYAKRPEGYEQDNLAQVHMLLLQKGSKGANWGPKPVLNFMHDLLNLCIDVLKDGGKRSRMLAEWYEGNPTKLYLPPELEHHRGQMITSDVLWKIFHLTNEPPPGGGGSATPVWDEIRTAGKCRAIPNPRSRTLGGHTFSRRTVQAVMWEDLEPILLRRVVAALEAVRRVTRLNHYEGRVSKMLMLFDAEETPYLPASIKYQSVRRRFKLTQRDRAHGMPSRTIFEKLDLTMVVDGKVQHAWIDTHDPRRWLTTQAMNAKERLSDVLINKWANRLSIDQLKHYDLRSDTQKADAAAMPTVHELADISDGLQKIEGIESRYGLTTEIVTAHDAGVSVTSMEAVASAVEDRPVARTSTQIIILYPSRYGICLHQHHETPCRAYSSCLSCSENCVVKGHLPTNESIRERDKLLTRSIVSQLERFVTAHNRQIADSPDGLEAHMLSLVRSGLPANEMAEELIREFHEIKDRIASPYLRSKLEEAFVARGMVQRLDDPTVAAGALIRYHNPSRHASPGHERALEAHGGRAAIQAQLERFHTSHPQYAPAHLGLKDERDLLEPDEDDDDD